MSWGEGSKGLFAGESGLDAIALLHKAKIRSIALTISNDKEDVLGAIAAGASGYCLKDDPLPRILAAIHDACAGRTPLSSGVAHHLCEQIRPAETAVVLTKREEEVLVKLAEGQTYRECAEFLGIGLGTVQTYVKRIYSKLQVSTKTQACNWAIAHGLLRPMK